MSGPDERGDTHASTAPDAEPASPPETPTAEHAAFPDIREEWGSDPDRRGEPDTASDVASTARYETARSRRASVNDLPKKKVRGIARGVNIRSDFQNQQEKLTFRVDRYDVSGNRLAPVPVEMRRYRGGLVTDGDEVEVTGRWSRGTLHASRIRNLATASDVRSWFAGWGKWVAIVVGIALLGAFALLALALVSSDPAAGTVRVPNVVGRTVDGARAALRAKGLSPHLTTEASATVAAGKVSGTDPPADFPVAKHSSVTVVVSSGPLAQPGGPAPGGPSVGANTVDVPPVVGQSEASAFAALRNAGLNPLGTTVASETVPLGQVINVDPAPGSAVDRGSTVNVLVSSGPAVVNTTVGSVVVAEVAGDAEDVATAKLEDQGLSVTSVPEPSDAVDAGTAIRTDPAAGSSVPAASAVTLYVSSGPPGP